MLNALSESDVTPGIFGKFVRLIKYIAISYVISLVLIVALSAVVCYTDVPEAAGGPGVKVITFFGVFVSAFMSAARASGKGWLVGGIAGGLNIIILSFLGMIFADADVFCASNMVQISCGFAVGVVGGIFGINLSKK